MVHAYKDAVTLKNLNSKLITNGNNGNNGIADNEYYNSEGNKRCCIDAEEYLTEDNNVPT